MTPIALALAVLLTASEVTLVRGTVRDLQGDPVTGAAVYLQGTQTQTVTDGHGRFELAAPRGTQVVLVVFVSGFGVRRQEVATAGAMVELELKLDLASASDTITVRAAPLSPAEPQTIVTPLDVVRTPGTQADPFRLLRTFPGVVQIDEGAGLFVRGGDTSEVLVLLDGAPIAHPYRYETPTGGYFGFVDPFLLRGISFTTGGFPARFGNALSAVVELDGAAAPPARQATVTAGLAGAAMSLAYPDAGGWGVRLAGNLAFPKLLFAVNGDDGRFHRFPGGWDASLSLHKQTARGPLKLFTLQQADDVGVLLEGEGFAGFLDSATRQRLVVARSDAAFGAWNLRTSAGGGDYRSSTAVGVLRQQTEDQWLASRFELVRTSRANELHLGIDADWTRSAVDGQVPRRSGDFDGNGGVFLFAVDRDDRHAGAFADSTWSLKGFSTRLGLRADRFAEAEAWTVDPRLAVSHPWAGGKLRAAWGLYHQVPSTAYFDQVRGARRLPPKRAEHWVAGYERGEPESGLVRVEAYRKRYLRLPLEDAGGRGYTASGFGFAEGADLFAERTFPRGEVRASYSFLRAGRRWTPAYQRERFVLPAGTWEPDFSIPHSLQVVASWQPLPALSVGLSWRQASGRPFTPIVGAEAAGDGYLPVYGDINSQRLPPYQRLDLSLSRPVLVAGTQVLLFAGLSNVLDRANVFQYTYSADFSRRQPVKSAAPRSVYVGFSILDLWRNP